MVSVAGRKCGEISPLLWCIVVNSLLSRLVSACFYALAYADDIAILVRNETTISELMTKTRKAIGNWCQFNGFNSAKTGWFIFEDTEHLLDWGLSSSMMYTRHIIGNSIRIMLQKSRKMCYFCVDKIVGWTCGLSTELLCT